jgi:hypothetical protein
LALDKRAGLCLISSLDFCGGVGGRNDLLSSPFYAEVTP